MKEQRRIAAVLLACFFEAEDGSRTGLTSGCPQRFAFRAAVDSFAKARGDLFQTGTFACDKELLTDGASLHEASEGSQFGADDRVEFLFQFGIGGRLIF